MALQDVSHDSSMIDWLRQSGHGHLLQNQDQYRNFSSPPPTLPPHPPLSPPPPMISSGYSNPNPYGDSHHRPVPLPANASFNTHSYSPQQSPTNFMSSPGQFHAPHTDAHVDMEIENLKRNPNTRIVHRPPPDDVVYRQRVFVRYLQPPTPPVSGAIIVREKQLPPPPPDPPIVIRRAPPPPPTPPAVIIRERPPALPPPEATTIINKIVPPPAKPPRQVIIEQFPPLPPKPQDVIIERWLPVAPRQRRILYERLPPSAMIQPPVTGPIIIQHGQPRVRVHREVFNAPGAQLAYPQGLPQITSTQQIHSTLSPPSLISYNPYSSLQQTYGSITHPQSNIVVVQSEQPNILSPSSYGMPLSCMCTPNTHTGLGIYGSGISSVPTIGYSSGQSVVYNVPGNIPIDNVLRQLGVDPHSLQQSTDPHSAVSHVWNAASHANSSHHIDPHSAVAHVWNAASRASSPHPIDPHSAVAHVWNAASRASSPHPIDPHSAVAHVWGAASHANPPHSLGSHSATQHVWNAAAHATDHSHTGNNPPYYHQQQYNNPPQPPGAANVLSRLFGGNQ